MEPKIDRKETFLLLSAIGVAAFPCVIGLMEIPQGIVFGGFLFRLGPFS